MSNNMQPINLNGHIMPIYTDEPATDVVDQLMFAADEAGWMPPRTCGCDGDSYPTPMGTRCNTCGEYSTVAEWAEDTALVLIARSPRHAALDTVIIVSPAVTGHLLADVRDVLVNTSASDVANSANPVAM